MAGYIGNKAVGINVTTGDIRGDVGVGGDVTATTSDGAILNLNSSDTTITDGSVLGAIKFTAPLEGSGTDSVLLGAAIEAVAEATFAADNNATELVFKTGASAAADQKMTLTSAGNFLVGTTNITPSINGVEGIALSSGSFGGRLEACRDEAAAVSFGRLTDDGDIMDFKKDGDTMGSIGAFSSGTSALFFGSLDTALLANSGNDSIHPWNASTNGSRDNAIDLGNSSNRFKDFYLSGGAFIGGTGTANKLHDYEEGNWTPAITFGNGNTGQSYGNQVGRYTKIGRSVHCQYRVTFTDKGSSTGAAKLLGLPFTPSGINSGHYFGFLNGFLGTNIANFTQIWTIDPGTSQVQIRYVNASGNNVSISNSDFKNSSDIIASFTYQTDS